MKRQWQTFIKWSIECHGGSADVGSLTMSFFHILIHNKEGKRFHVSTLTFGEDGLTDAAINLD